ncbi:MAG TPA: hypothetical protein VN784_13765 [Candidatus Limnocylindrales bacterium]|nr:hypothetical protein [Candidatus Limnocylindrales bacterium]
MSEKAALIIPLTDRFGIKGERFDLVFEGGGERVPGIVVFNQTNLKAKG